MSTLVRSSNSRRLDGVSTVKVDKSGWTDLQHIQFTIGLWDGIEGHPVKVWELPRLNWVPNERYMKLRGILSGHSEISTTEIKRRDREWEQEHDAQKFGVHVHREAE